METSPSSSAVWEGTSAWFRHFRCSSVAAWLPSPENAAQAPPVALVPRVEGWNTSRGSFRTDYPDPRRPDPLRTLASSEQRVEQASRAAADIASNASARCGRRWIDGALDALRPPTRVMRSPLGAFPRGAKPIQLVQRESPQETLRGFCCTLLHFKACY